MQDIGHAPNTVLEPTPVNREPGRLALGYIIRFYGCNLDQIEMEERRP